jgi:hypothetical protein
MSKKRPVRTGNPDIRHNLPLDQIYTQIVFRSLYHFSQAVLRGDASEAIPYLVEHQKLF